MNKNEFQDELEIDVLSLDEAWIKQPRLYMKYSDMLAETKRELDEKKHELKVVEANLLLEAAAGGEQIIGSKPTVSSIEAWVKAQPIHKDLMSETNKKEYEVNILSSAVKAFEQKKTALENLVKLWQGSYFSGPSEPKDYSATDGIAEQVKPKRRK